MDDTVTLYRPVGQEEPELIEGSGFESFPPRLREQPIFYPVLNEEYATQIARDWNARMNDDQVGYVTRFKISRQFIECYERHIVGGSLHEEYWIPADDLVIFNQNMIDKIEGISKFKGSE